ncbi:MAG: DUF4168 domain-containing protein [Thermodesulfobacteriota bacterium]
MNLLTAVFTLSLLLMTAIPALAQDDQYQENAESGNMGTETEITDSQLEKAAEAYSNVAKISKEFQASIQGVEDQDKIGELQEDANNKMIKAIEDAGLEVETYNTVLEQIRSDEELRSEFMSKLDNGDGGMQ